MLLIEIVKFVLRLLKHLTILLLISLPLQLLSLIVLAIYLPFSKSDKLPSYLKWFDNADVWIGRDTSTYEGVIAKGLLYRYYWLTIRNPLNYFGYSVLGVSNFSMKGFSSYVSPPGVVIGDSSHYGFLYSECEIEGKTYYEYYLIAKIGQNHCLRFRMGYKFGQDPKLGEQTEQVLVLQPYISYTGE